MKDRKGDKKVRTSIYLWQSEKAVLEYIKNETGVLPAESVRRAITEYIEKILKQLKRR